MVYLGLAFSVLWIALFGYLYTIDAQIRDMKRRLQARYDSGSGAD